MPRLALPLLLLLALPAQADTWTIRTRTATIHLSGCSVSGTFVWWQSGYLYAACTNWSTSPGGPLPIFPLGTVDLQASFPFPGGGQGAMLQSRCALASLDVGAEWEWVCRGR